MTLNAPYRIKNPDHENEEQNCGACSVVMVNGQCQNTYCRSYATADRFEESIYPDLDVSKLVPGILMESL